MESTGIISKVDEPTPWCARMVVVPKNDGKVRMCKFEPLNENILQEVHPLALLTGAKVFSKLDANSGFWQIPLSKSLRLLTTFIIPTGHHCLF